MQTGVVSHSRSNFTGKERDTETGFANGNDYFGARYYASSMGRFMSPDYNDDGDEIQPVPYTNLEDPQGLNQYAYAGNNPLTFADPDGHSKDCGGGGDPSVVCMVTTAWDWLTSHLGGGGGGSNGNGDTGPSSPPPNNPNFTPQLHTRAELRAAWQAQTSKPGFWEHVPVESDVMPWGMTGGLSSAWASGVLSGAEQKAVSGVLNQIARGTTKGKEFENQVRAAYGGVQALAAQAPGYYREYTVSLGAGRGAARLVTGLGGEIYYTVSHYSTWIKLR